MNPIGATGGGAAQPAEDRPCRIPHWTLRERRGAGGKQVYILKDDVRARYLLLRRLGVFVWSLLDGTRTCRDVALTVERRHGSAAAANACALLARLQREGFVSDRAATMTLSPSPSGSRGGLAAGAHRLLTAQLTLPDVDAGLTVLYRRIGRHAFSAPAQILWLVLAVGGGAAFLALWLGARVSLGAGGGSAWLAGGILALGWLIHVPFHELQHGLVAKHFGREVRHAGVGWFWFAPMCWIDTSDVWLEGRWRRVAVSFAGPYSNLVLGGALSLLVRVLPDGIWRGGLFAVAGMLYLGFLTAFNLLLEYDGYYMLMDVLETSNLRREALGFLAQDLLPRLRAGRLTRAEQGYALYGLLALAYLAGMAAAIVLTYRNRLERSVGAWIPAPVAALLGWVAAGIFLLVVALGAAHELRVAGASRRAGVRSDRATCEGEALERRISK